MHPAPTHWAKHEAPPTPSREALRRLGLEGLRGEGGGGRIRCPRCRWKPHRLDRWGCRCGHSWNTFDTRGRCPRCDYQWRNTQCLRCHEFSPHEDWYAPGSGPDEPGAPPAAP